MSTARVSMVAVLLALAVPACAHRLDEYLQATTIAIEKDRIEAHVRLIPGIAVLPVVIASIDTNADGVLSQAEQHAYADRVQRDLRLTIDGAPVELQRTAFAFPSMHALEDGLGEIELRFEARVPPSAASGRKLVFENRHQPAIGVYLVNSLVPDDPRIRITAQNRNYPQSRYELDYAVAGAAPGAVTSASWLHPWTWFDVAAFLLVIFALALIRRFSASRRRRTSFHPGPRTLGRKC
jgi:hypothetical protein